jgi:hypothetical protein
LPRRDDSHWLALLMEGAHWSNRLEGDRKQYAPGSGWTHLGARSVKFFSSQFKLQVAF